MQIHNEIREMTHEEELTYFRSKAQNGPLVEWWNRRKRHDAHISCCADKGEEYQARESKELQMNYILQLLRGRTPDFVNVEDGEFFAF